MSKEKKFIIDLIFNNKIFQKTSELNFEKIIKISSSNLVIPLLFSKVKEFNLNEKLEKGFVDYLKFIYDTNYERNKLIFKQVNDLGRALSKNKIEHVFFKRSCNACFG